MKRTLLIILSIFLYSCATFPQQGTLDPTFNPNDIGFGNGDGADATVFSVNVQTDGKILITGGFYKYNGKNSKSIARLNADGTFDNTFQSGITTTQYIYSAGFQSNGKIIIAGTFTDYNGMQVNRIARLNSDGSLDSSFLIGTGADNFIRSMLVQNDDKIIIGGNFTSFNGTSRNRLARLNADGTLDTLFNPGTGANALINSLAFQDDGKIIVAGNFTLFNSLTSNRIVRINPNGSYDNTFNSGSGANGNVISTLVQPDGKIIVGGAFTSYNGTSLNRIARLLSDGTLDTSFNPGTGANNTVNMLAIQPDGKVIAGGDFTSFNGLSFSRIVRLASNGSIDNTFDVGNGFSGIVWICKILNNSKLVIGGQFSSYNDIQKGELVLIDTDGNLDLNFNTGSGANSYISNLLINADQKIYITGGFSLYNGIPYRYIVRLTQDGEIDAGFNVGSGTNEGIICAALQSDGKIIITGHFVAFNGITRNRIARINTDGSLDLTFDPGGGADALISAIGIQNDGKIIIGGYFTTYNGTAVMRIARLNPDGSLDATFNMGSGCNSGIKSIFVQNDGKITIAGDFTSYNSVASNRIIRINSDGSPDLSFNIGSGPNSSILSAALQSDGKVLIGGYFTSFNGISRSRLARLHSDGSLDAGFETGSGVDNEVHTISVQDDGKIFIGGIFMNYNDISCTRVALINSDGSLDTTFHSGVGANARLLASAIQDDGKIIIAGEFTAYNQTGRNRVARIISCNTTSSTLTEVACGSYTAPDGQVFYSSGFKTAIISNAAGCDSIITIDLTIYQGFLDEVYDTICSTDSVQWRGAYYKTQGIWHDSLLTQHNCDSVYVLHLSTIPADTYYRDFDGDGFGDPDNIKYACTPPAGYSTNNLDCNDNNYNINPNAYEVCDGVDNNCNGLTDADDPNLAKPLCEKQMGVCAGALKPAYLCVGGGWLPCNDLAYAGHSANYANTDITCDNTDNDCDGSYDEDSEAFLFQDFIEICDGEIVLWRGQYYTQTGIYWDSLQSHYGCDSIYILNLSVNPTYEFTENAAICNGDLYPWHGQNLNAQGTYYDSLRTMQGCDSVYILNLTVNSIFEFILNDDICQGETYLWRGNSYDTQGIYYDSLTTQNGCDSLYVLNLTVNPIFEFVLNNDICQGETYLWRGNYYDTQGIYYDSLTTQYGCDSVYALNLTVNPIFEFTLNDDNCLGETYLWRGNSYDTQGIYYDSLTTRYGCDSVYVLNLTINPIFEYVFNGNICQGDTYMWRGNSYDIQGTYYDSLSTQYGCDSVYVLNLIVNPVYEFVLNYGICPGETYLWKGNSYDTQGTYYESLTTQNGCDSVYVLNLSVNPVYEFVSYDTICQGDTYIWRGYNYDTAGTYYDSLSTSLGCDSIYVLNLTINPVYEIVLYDTICQGIIYHWRGDTFSIQGTYYDSLKTNLGCDSVYILNLFVNPSYLFVDIEDICQGNSFAWHGQTYTQTGIYFDSLSTTLGCDSVYQLNLTIHLNYLFTENDSICEGEVLLWHGIYIDSAGTYTDSLNTMMGCDSIYVLNAHVNALPIVSINITSTDYCVYNDPVLLAGTPTGGTFSGNGISGNFFDPQVAGTGTWDLVYTFTDAYLCTGSDTVTLTVDDCAGTETYDMSGIHLYPNPNKGLLTIELNQKSTLVLYDMLHRKLFEMILPKGAHLIDISHLSNGMYYLSIINGTVQLPAIKIIKTR